MARTYLGEVQLNPPANRERWPGAFWVPDVPWHEARNAFGPFLAQDVGKRVYRVDGVLQMENDEQRGRRLDPRAHWRVIEGGR